MRIKWNSRVPSTVPDHTDCNPYGSPLSASYYLCLSLLDLPAILPTGSLLFTEELCSGTQWTKNKKPFQVGGKAMWAGKTKNASPKAQGWEGKLVGRVKI